MTYAIFLVHIIMLLHTDYLKLHLALKKKAKAFFTGPKKSCNIKNVFDIKYIFF